MQPRPRTTSIAPFLQWLNGSGFRPGNVGNAEPCVPQRATVHECRHAAVNMELPWKNQSSRHVHAIEGMLQTKPARTNACNFNIILGSHRV